MLKRICFSIVGLTMLIISCKKDSLIGDIKEINEVKIGGIAASYTVSLGVPLVITPELKFTQDNESNTGRYQYEWYSAEGVRVDIANTRNLNTEIKLTPGTHNSVYYRVTDTQTGVKWTKMFSISIVTPIYEGWLVLGDVDGIARLDMVSLKDNVYTPIYDVLGLTGSALKLKGSAVDVSYFPYRASKQGIYVSSTGTGTTKIDPESFAWDAQMYISYESLIPSLPDNYLADFVQPKGNRGVSYMYKDGKFYYNKDDQGYRYSVPINVMTGSTTEFRAAPFVASVIQGDFSTNGASVLYDATNRKFVNHQPSSVTCSDMPAGTLFNFTTGKDLVYMESTTYNGSFANGDVFAVLKDEGAPNYHLARISLAAFGVSFQQNYWDVMNATDISLAENFAVSPDLGYVFYNVGGKLYEYDMFLKKSKLMLDKGAEKITMLRFHKFVYPFGAATPKYSNKLIVGSYDPARPSASSGKLELFTVPAVNADLVVLESYTGFGKIKDITYRERYPR
ncbi:hypothetical protein DBR43_03400 [Pedobacter sp. KBW06]|uniref:PKD-like family lipoprotein n=1 Tax=Pedobacter sp. KBW06 TaxID=2153359 RepID=UPI000F59D940|nr:PKD-like family lipoprotein [Pedobacter sp. KBW06]RQO74451.1 hypothetical protein DBR43_03400 [Pedobacter sp. KBW06]